VRVLRVLLILFKSTPANPFLVALVALPDQPRVSLDTSITVDQNGVSSERNNSQGAWKRSIRGIVACCLL